MISGAQIRDDAEKQGRRSKKERKQPVSFSQEELDLVRAEGFDCSPRRIPWLGEYTPDGMVRVHTLFVDSSGFGQDGEIALSLNELFKRIHPAPYAYGIVERGEYQVYIDEFLPEADLPLEELHV